MRHALPLALLLAALPALADDAAPQDAEFFEARVRPVLVEHCIKCHGPEKQNFGLRLDSADALRKGGDAGPVVVPGDPENSPLVEAIGHAGPVKMPPKQKLPDQAVADLTQWVKRGAPWPAADTKTAGAAEAWRDHWAFQPIRNPEPPDVRRADWPRNAVDRFVLARLDAKDLAPSPEADRRTLIRRATFDLTGLPPTPEQVDAFVNDTRPDAHEQMIERLLASPAYGERWGRHWLDVARYADTKGYVFEQDPDYHFAYTYRDWVVRAFNDDLPYDVFITQQLAADRLPTKSDPTTLAALGFLTVGSRFMGNKQDMLDDRVDVTTRGLMGLTVACARCHDHKFDPIPAEDYYSLYGVFASSDEPAEPPLLGPAPQTDDYAKYAAELKKRQGALDEFIRSKHEAVTAAARTRAAEYLLAALPASKQPDTAEFMLLADAGDLNPTMIRRWQRLLERAAKEHDPIFSPWHALAELPADGFADRAGSIVAALGSDPAQPVNPIVARALADAAPRSLVEVAKVYGFVLNNNEAICQDYARRAALNGQPTDAHPDPAREPLRQVFHGADAPPNLPYNPEGGLALLPDRESQAKARELRKQVETWRDGGAGAPPRAMALVDKDKPVEPRVFLRGNPGNPGEAVPRRFLRVVAGEDRKPFQDGSGRLDLARAIVDRSNPLTARVLVNRVWMHHFGAPIVGTPSDFGLRSDPPTHPDLLDHLATAFMDGGWSIKRLHRLIMNSAAYRQSSADRPDARAVDPENVLLWRQNRRRLDLEATRDALLAAAGRLDNSLGGPPMPELAAAGSTRRTLYAKVDRHNLPGLFRTFDFPDPSSSSPRRDQTTVPPQALFLMNNPFVIDSARAVLRRPEVASADTPGPRIVALYRLLYGRAPSAAETSLGASFVGKGEPVAWERYVQALLIANEFVFVD